MIRKFIVNLLAPKIVQFDDVILTRDGRAYWVRPSGLVQLRIIPVGKIKETE